MPEAGSDQQRGGWYDVVDRILQPGHENHRFTWHDRKAWWQQEQAILAYQIMAGSTGDDDALRRVWVARRPPFYNAFYLDYEEGSRHFNVLASGVPYLLGTERQKGSHSMAGYHSFELAYLATVTQPPRHQGADGPRTQPDPRATSPATSCGSRPTSAARQIRIGEVEVDGSRTPISTRTS